jgi:acyl-CoA reductase-like NAD-dependent aldehyde dehydrogenase
VAISNSLRLGHGLDEKTDVGPMINERQRERVEQLVTASIVQGARVLTGGERGEGRGWFYRPTVVTDVGPGMPVYDEEIFGPVMPIVPFSDESEALRMANAGEHGLAAFVLTNDLNRSIRLSEQLEYGMVSINDWLPATPEAPFGGVKGSGFGRETGLEGLHEYMEEKTIFTGDVG